MQPGMTGLAQVHGLREDSSAEERTRFDLQYVMRPYLLRDISLLLQTIGTLAQRLFSVSKANSSDIPRPIRAFIPEDLTH
jgi:lipopolysaccharide/colanic/teichoic acid biosynthesis glycosyltransferase